ncbi:MAG: MBL fold metallo-hydrolase [Spirochaetaceae bacterium]|nr:MAG: MBL fold metallo-hydrolase [Spirochaetaceae bacterium]
MILTFLGTGTSHGVPMLACSCPTCRSTDHRDVRTNASILLSVEGKNILFDCGRDFHGQAIRQGIDRIDFLLLTHTHFDHVAGIDELRVFTARQKQSIPVFGKQEHLNYLKTYIYHYLFDPAVQRGGGIAKIELVALNGRFSLEGIKIEPLPVYHGCMEILGYRFGNTAYLSDVSRIPETTREKLFGLDVLIVGALRHTEHPTHFNIPQALGIVSDLQPKRAFFTHICHDILHEAVDRQFADPTSPYFSPVEVHLAYDGLTLEL